MQKEAAIAAAGGMPRFHGHLDPLLESGRPWRIVAGETDGLRVSFGHHIAHNLVGGATPQNKLDAMTRKAGGEALLEGFSALRADLGEAWVELNTGFTLQVDRFTSLYANGSYQLGVEGDSEAWTGKIGLRVNW